MKIMEHIQEIECKKPIKRKRCLLLQQCYWFVVQEFELNLCSQYHQLLGFGTDLQYQWYRFGYKSGISNAELKNIQHMTAFKFYVMLNVQGNEGIDFAFQPYLVLPSNYFDEEFALRLSEAQQSKSCESYQ